MKEPVDSLGQPWYNVTKELEFERCKPGRFGDIDF